MHSTLSRVRTAPFRLPRCSARSFAAFTALAACTLLLPACNSLYSAGATTGAGIAGAAAASKVTRNAAVATGIGLGAVASAQAGVQYTQRVAHRYTQAQIAAAAGPLEVGGVAAWATHHVGPIEPDEHGRVTVSRLISVGPLDCKEIVFSVDADINGTDPGQSQFYVATLCRDGAQWKWASAEPATARWSPLQ